MANSPIGSADRAKHLEFLQTLDGPGRKRFSTAYKQHAALQIMYGLATDDDTEDVDKDLLQSRMAKIVREYAQSECYELMQKISSTLPTELRDMVYGYVWDTKTADAAFDNVKDFELRFAPWLEPCSREPCECFQPYELPLYVQHQVVGLQMAREVATAYYKAMPPERLGHDIGRLRAFLTRDHFHLGIFPAEHIRHLRIDIAYATCPQLCEIEDDTEYFSSEDLQLIQQSMTELDLIPRKAGFRVTMVLGDNILLGETQKALEAMRASYENFTQAGMHVRVYFHPEFRVFPTLRIDHYYALHKGLWEDFVNVTAYHGYPCLERPSDDDSPDEAAWLNRSADELVHRGYSIGMIDEPSHGMRMQWRYILIETRNR